MYMKVLPFPVEFSPFEMFTRATPGNSLVDHIENVCAIMFHEVYNTYLMSLPLSAAAK